MAESEDRGYGLRDSSMGIGIMILNLNKIQAGLIKELLVSSPINGQAKDEVCDLIFQIETQERQNAANVIDTPSDN